jgi:6-phosphogluconolactonase (cycloisomerase 2 family)
MKIGTWARLALAVAPLLTGCSGFWNPPKSPTPPTTLTSGFFYVLNAGTNQVAGFYVNKGVLTAVPGSPYSLAATPLAIAVAPTNAFLYVSTLSGIYVYSIATNGQLTLGNNSQLISADQAASMQVDSTNTWLVEAFTGVAKLWAIHINSSTGLPASTIQQSVPLASSLIQQVKISPDNKFAFVALGTGGTAVVPFNPNSANPFVATATYIPVKNSGGGAISLAFDPITSATTTPRAIYIGETAASPSPNTGGLRVFTYSDFKEISGSPFAINGLAPSSILPFSSGSFVYVLNRQVSGSSTGIITGFSIADTNGFTLTPLGSTFTVGTNPQDMIEDSTGAFVFAVNFNGNPDLTGYTINSTKAGYLDTVISAATGTGQVKPSSIGALH